MFGVREVRGATPVQGARPRGKVGAVCDGTELEEGVFKVCSGVGGIRW